MRYDGQYWHYIDKWLLALARTNHVEEGIRIAKSCFPFFFSSGDGSSSFIKGGIRWKLSVDGTPPPSLPPTYGPNDDTLNALIVFSILEKQNASGLKDNDGNCTNNTPLSFAKLSLQNEINLLQQSLSTYHPRVTNDPLGWGLEALFDQFVMNHPRTEQLRDLAPDALHPSHLSLPFRLYGALIGARAVSSTDGSGDLVSPHSLAKLMDLCVHHQLREMKKSFSSRKGSYEEEEHASINRVMLAMALLSPGVLKRREDDPMVRI